MSEMLFGTETAAETGLPEPPAPEGPGLFGDAPAPPPAAPPAKPETLPAAKPETAPGAAPYRVLARKYRPSTFAELVGQEALVRTLRNAFAQDRVAHAYLLTGVRGVGKTTTARIIARALNCIGPDGRGGPTPEPCGVCPECRAILADRHPDVQELDAASNNGIDDVRELRERLRFRPAQGRFKVIILDEVHMMSTAAFNALLKTLEEPPPQVKFMLATTELRKVPATILSRCQTFHLKRVSQAELRAHFSRLAALEGIAIEPEALAMVARAADGSVRDGLSLLDQAIALAGSAKGEKPGSAGGEKPGSAGGEKPGSAGGGPGASVSAEAVRDMLGLADRSMILDLMEAVMAGDLATALGLMDRAHDRGADPGVVLADLLELTHTLTRLRSVPALRDDPALTEAERTRGAALAAQLSVPILGRAWQMLLKGLGEVNEAPDRRAAAEMVLIRLAHVAELPTPGDLVKRLLAEGAAAPPAGPVPGGGGGLRALAGGGAALAAPLAAPSAAPLADAVAAAPQPQTWREVVALASGRRPLLHAHLVHSAHPVRIAPGRIELRPAPGAPQSLAGDLGALLAEATGTRWTIALSNAEGEPTLAQQGRVAEAGRRSLAESHPLVQAVLAAFPGTQIEAVRDAGVDAYGLTEAEPGQSPAAEAEAEAEAREFAPLDAETAGYDDLPSDDE